MLVSKRTRSDVQLSLVLDVFTQVSKKVYKIIEFSPVASGHVGTVQF